jgi:hypothetical protein
MKKQRIPWEKAPKIKGAILIGHAFSKNGDGAFVYMGDYIGVAEFYDQPSYLNRPKGLYWKTSFTPAPRKRK